MFPAMTPVMARLSEGNGTFANPKWLVLQNLSSFLMKSIKFEHFFGRSWVATFGQQKCCRNKRAHRELTFSLRLQRHVQGKSSPELGKCNGMEYAVRCILHFYVHCRIRHGPTSFFYRSLEPKWLGGF